MMPPHLSGGEPRGGSSTLVLVFGGVAVVSLLVAVGAVVFAVRRTTAVAAPIASAPITTSTSTTGSTPTPAGSLLIVDGEVKPGTPQSSIRARPSWGRLDVLSPYAKETSQYVPQTEKQEEIFAAGKPIDHDLDGELVVCRMTSFGGHDTFAGDDLHVRATFGQTPEVANDGPEDANLGWVTAPLVHLANGDDVRFEIYDRDAFELEAISSGKFKFTSAPVTFSDSHATLECRAVDRGAQAKLTQTRAAIAFDALTALSRKKLDGVSASWGWPLLDQVDAQRKIGDAAALVGWDNPVVVKVVARHDEVVVGLEQQRAAVFDSLRASAKDEARVNGTRVKMVRASCVGAACSATATVTNGSDSPLSIGGLGHGSLSFYIASRAGGPLDAHRTDPRSPNGEIAPGVTVDVDLVARGAAKTDDSVLVGVCDEARCTPLRMP